MKTADALEFTAAIRELCRDLKIGIVVDGDVFRPAEQDAQGRTVWRGPHAGQECHSNNLLDLMQYWGSTCDLAELQLHVLRFDYNEWFRLYREGGAANLKHFLPVGRSSIKQNQADRRNA